MNIVVGIDPSSKKLAAVVTDAHDVFFVFFRKLPDTADMSERCRWAYKHSRTLVRKIQRLYPGEAIYVFIEDPVVGRGGAYSTIAQSKVHGAILAGLRSTDAEITVRGVNNSQAKKAVVGKGNADKPAIRKWCQAYWKQLYRRVCEYNKGDQQDIIDAGMINRHGTMVVKRMNRIRNERRRATGRTRRR